ncbi:MAG: hypothetical protein WAQ28_02610 [Bacteroidia bacterium]
MRYKLFLFFLPVFIYSCSPVKYIKPLARKEHAANVSLGGPLIGFADATIPIPFITANYGYGLDSTLTLFSGINITSALYGNLQAELGLTKQLLLQRKYIPAISLTPVANIIYRNKNAFKFYPQLAANFFWEYGKRKNFIYLGCDNWFELSKKRAFGIEQKNHWIAMPFVGHTLTGGQWNLTAEAKIIAPDISNEKLVVDYKTPLKNKGALGVYVSYTYKFKKK